MQQIKSKSGAVAPSKSGSASGNAAELGSAAADRSGNERANSMDAVHGLNAIADSLAQTDWVIDEAIRDFEHARRVYRIRQHIRALNAVKPWSFT
jgi:hypothetical protein